MNGRNGRYGTDNDVTVKPATPATPKAKSTVSPPGPSGDPLVWWDNYFKSHNETPAEFQRTVVDLIKEKSSTQVEKDKKFAQVEAAIKFYLRHHGRQAEPWMYEWLVKAIENRKASLDEIKLATSYAAVLAKKTMNPTDLIRVADMMVLRGLYGPVGPKGFETNIGELVDMAAQKVPNNIVPPMMSVNLAVKTKDPFRMADAADRLLSLGWPGYDDKMRLDLNEQVAILSKALQDDGRIPEAEVLARKVDEARVRDLFVSLKWVGEADLDLAVEEPFGATAKYDNPRTVLGGAMLTNGYGKHPEEIYACPRAFDGTYTIRVDMIYNDEAKPVREAVLTVITHEGGADEKRESHTIKLDKPEPVLVKLTGGRRKVVLPFIAPPEAPPQVKAQTKSTRVPAGSTPKDARPPAR